MEDNEQRGTILYYGFNSSSSRVCVGTKSGFIVYDINAWSPLYSDSIGGCIMVRTYRNHSIVGVVRSGDHPSHSDKVVSLFSTKNDIYKELRRFIFETVVINFKFNKHIAVIATETKVFVYKIKDIGAYPREFPTELNRSGAMDLGISPETMLICYPGNTTDKGDLTIVKINPETLEETSETLHALHDDKLAFIRISMKGEYVATADVTGTIIKVTSIDNPTEQYVFKRSQTSSQITSLEFNEDCTILSVASKKGTIHFFKIEHQVNTSYLSSWFSTERRSFAQIRNTKSPVVSFSENDEIYVLHDTKLTTYEMSEPQLTPSFLGSLTNYEEKIAECRATGDHNLINDHPCFYDDD